MELKKWMVVEHRLFRICVIEDFHENFVIFSSSIKDYHKLEKKMFSSYVTPMLDKKGNQVYARK